LIVAEITHVFGQSSVSPPERHQHFLGMAGIEEIHQGAVLAFKQSDLQVPHEPACGEPEIVPHEHHGLDMLAIAVPKSGDQFSFLLTPPSMEPLFELVEDQQYLPLKWQDATSSQVCQRIDQTRSSGQFRTRLAQAIEQPGFGLLRGRLDVNRQDVLGQSGK
jgi:hypothetical protein